MNAGPMQRSDLDRVAVGLMVALLVVGLAPRIWQLGSTPDVFFFDECDNTFNAIQILAGRGPGPFGLDWKPQPALAVHLIAVSIKLVGGSVAAARLPSAFLGALAVPLLFVVARRLAGPWPAAAAALMFAFHPSALHLSRSGWENVQICVWTLAAMEAVQRAADGRHRAWWVAAGLFAAIAGMTYFAGWLLSVVLFGWFALEALLSPGRRRHFIAGAALAAIGFGLLVGPLVWTLRAAGPGAFQRVQTVAVSSGAEGARPGAATIEVAHNLWNGLRAAWSPSANHQPLYAPPGKALFDLPTLLLASIGIGASLARARSTALWWLALAVPFIVTQGFAHGAPNIARGIGALPILYLFVALGIGRSINLASRGRRSTTAILALLAVTSASSGASSYWDWGRGPELRSALQPAIPVAQFPEWWDFQVRWVADNPGFCNLRTYLERRRSNPDSAESAFSP